MLGLIFRRAFTTAFMPLKPNVLSDNYGARYQAKKLGRGRASGKGKTSGRGHKGTKAREGGSVHPRFEGGQTPITLRIPKWGFNRNAFRKPLEFLNFSRLYYYIDKERIDTTKTITLKEMFEAGIFSRIQYGVKLMAGGIEKIDRPLHFEVTDASKRAIEAVNSKGGSVTLLYKTKKQVEYTVKPYKFGLPMRDYAMPPPKVAIKWKKRENKGAIVKYVKPAWLENWVEPVVPEMPRFIRKPKRQVVRKIDYNLKISG